MHTYLWNATPKLLLSFLYLLSFHCLAGRRRFFSVAGPARCTIRRPAQADSSKIIGERDLRAGVVDSLFRRRSGVLPATTQNPAPVFSSIFVWFIQLYIFGFALFCQKLYLFKKRSRQMAQRG